MEQKMTDEMIDYISILAKLTLSEQEKKKAGEDMEQMLQYIDRLNELDTEGVEPAPVLSFSGNVLREDRVSGENGFQGVLKNAPEVREGMFQVPCTIVKQEEL